MKTQWLTSIQSLRALAVLLVVAVHLMPYAQSISGNSPFWGVALRLALSVGHSGVDLFFVISGVLMYRITREPRRKTRLGEAIDFILRRLIRIMPAFWVALAFAIWAGGTPWTAWPGDALLITDSEALPTAWTLILEVRFYLVVALILLVTRQLRPAYVVFVIASLVTGIVWHALFVTRSFPDFIALILSQYEVWRFTSPMMCEFASGILVAMAAERYRGKAGALAFVAGMMLLLCSYGLIHYHLFLAPERWNMTIGAYRVVVLGVPMALICYGAMAWEMTTGARVPRSITAFGDVSYSLYLWHLPLIMALLPFFPKSTTPSFTAGLVYVGAMLSVSLAASVLSFLAIERPAIRLGHRVFGHRAVSGHDKRPEHAARASKG